MIDTFGKLFKKIYEQDFHLVTHFPMEGKVYKDQKIRLMLVGRCLNGWSHKKTELYPHTYEGRFDNLEEYIEEAYKAINDCDRFEWVQENRTKYGELKDYTNSSAFWTYAHAVLNRLNGLDIDAKDSTWYERIVWANLYPVAPSEGGNPSDGVIQAQREPAKELFIQAIEYYKPTHILLETGWDYWFHYRVGRKQYGYFVDESYVEPDYSEVGDPSKNKEHVIWSGLMAKCPTVIAKRPELRNKTEYVENVVKAFEDIKEQNT